MHVSALLPPSALRAATLLINAGGKAGFAREMLNFSLFQHLICILGESC